METEQNKKIINSCSFCRDWKLNKLIHLLYDEIGEKETERILQKLKINFTKYFGCLGEVYQK